MEENKETKPAQKKLTLKDLVSTKDKVSFEKNADDFKALDVNDIAPKKPNFNPEDTPIVKAYKDLDDAMERKKNEVKGRLDKARKEIIEARVEQSLASESIASNTEVSIGGLDDSDPLDELMEDIESKEVDHVVPQNVKAAMESTPVVEKEEPKEEVKDTPKKEVSSTKDLLKEQEDRLLGDNDDENEGFLDEEDDDSEEDIIDTESEEQAEKERKDIEERRRAAFKEYQKKIKECINPMKTGKVIDISKFKIRRKPVAYSKLLAERAVSAKTDKAHVSSWILPNSGRTITLTEFNGTDLEALGAADNNNLNSLQRLTRFYSTIYRHVVDPNKPSTLEAWLKSISLLDINHINFAVYKASFEQSNYVTEVCNNKKCLAMDLVKHPIMDMVKFKDEETKKKYMDLFDDKENATPSTIEERPVQINDKYVIGIRFPSIYHSLFESTQIARPIAIKHQALLTNMAYISSIYAINEATEELIPIDFKPVSDSFKTTVENKFKVIARVLKELKPDEFAYLQSAIVNISNEQAEQPGDITYVYPASKCSKCGSPIEESIQENPITMVFTRLQLTQESNF